MPNRDKVIKALEYFSKNRICLPHLIPWDEIVEAISLLKEQEPIEPVTYPDNAMYPQCGNCGEWLLWDDKFCSNCGRAVKRNDTGTGGANNREYANKP